MEQIESALRKLAVVVPELKPLIPAIVSDLAAAEKAEVIFAPALARMENNEPAFLELAAALPNVEPLLPEVAATFRLVRELRALVAQYQARIAAA